MAPTPAFPVSSQACTVTTSCPPVSGIPLQFQEVVPLQTPLLPRSLAQVTCITRPSSAADPPKLNGEFTVAKVDPLVGLVIATVGQSGVSGVFEALAKKTAICARVT